MTTLVQKRQVELARGARGTFKRFALERRMRRNEEDFTHQSLASLSQMVQSAAGVRTHLPLLLHAIQLTAHTQDHASRSRAQKFSTKAKGLI